MPWAVNRGNITCLAKRWTSTEAFLCGYSCPVSDVPALRDGDLEVPLVLAGSFHERLRGSAGDLGVLRSVERSGGHYETHVQRFMASVVDAAAVCVDVGANLGVHTLQLARLAPQGRVYALEPSPLCFRYLTENIDLAGVANVQALPIALGAEGGEATLNESVVHPGGSFISRTDAEETTKVAINIETLDTLAGRLQIERLDFVKVDIEGLEVDFLKGARRTLSAQQPIIVMECNPVALHRFQNQRAVDLFSSLKRIYRTVGYLTPAGDPVKIYSTGHLRRLLATRGLLDLVAGVVMVRNRRGLARELLDWLRSLALRSPLGLLLSNVSRSYEPPPEYIADARVELSHPRSTMTAQPGDQLVVPVRIRNRSWNWLPAKSGSRPVEVAYRILDCSTQADSEGAESFALSNSLPPFGAATAVAVVTAPLTPGTYRLRLTLKQRDYAWFDWFSTQGNACDIELRVAQPRQTPKTRPDS